MDDLIRRRRKRSELVTSFSQDVASKSELTSNLVIVANYLMDLAHRWSVAKGQEASDDPSAFNWDADPATVKLSDSIVYRLADISYRDRRARDDIFSDYDLFGEPAWDILLDLLRAERNGVKISITSSCIASAVPPTTALRWIKVLEESGLLYREEDLKDTRRTFLKLSDRARSLLRSYFRKVRLLEPGLW